jgi:CRP-like cAMP-binding protein/membrane protein YdbS with pleckstrin-like domain
MEDPAVAYATAVANVVQRLVGWGLPADEVEYALRGAVEVIDLDPRRELFAQDAPVTAVYLIESGGVYQERVVADAQGGRRVVLRRHAQPGEWIGHYDLLYSQQYSTRARTTDFTRLVVVQAAALNRLLARYPKLRQRIAPLDKIGRLRTIPVFGSLNLALLSYLADACQAERIPAGTQLYAADQPADTFFVVDQGQVVLTGDGYPTTPLGNGMAFGFLARPPVNPDSSVYGHAAQTTVPSTIFTIPRDTLIALTGLDPEAAGDMLRRQAESALDAVTVFSQFGPDERRALLGYMSHYFIPTHHLLMQQGEVGDSLWVLMPGSRATLHALEDGQALQPTVVQGPNFFGELALRVEHALNSTVQAEPGSQWLRLHNGDFQSFLRDYGHDLLNQLTLSPKAEEYLGRAQERRRYAWLQQSENLVVFQRRHWLALLSKVTLSLILSVLTLILWVLLSFQGWLNAWAWGAITVAGSVSLVSFVWGVLDHFNDYLLITNQRFVRQEKVIFVTENRQAAMLEQIRNIDIVVSFLGNLLGYGTLRVATAAAGGSIDFDFVPDPDRIKQTILEQQNRRQLHYQASSRMVIQNLLEERFGLRLRLPERVRPDASLPTIQLGLTWWDRLREWLDPSRHLEIRMEDRTIWRKHWFVLLGRLLGPGLGLFLILALVIGQTLLPADIQRYVTPVDVLLVLVGLVLLGWFSWNVADWRNDTYEVSDKEIADVEKKPLFFSEQRRTALLGEIENIEVNIPSPLHYLLNFGNVRLQTAASQGEFSFDWVPNPRGVSEEIRRRIEVYRQKQEANRARQRAQELPDWFELYNRLGPEGATNDRQG